MINHADTRSKRLAWQISQQISVRSTASSAPAEKTTRLGTRQVSRGNADETLTRAFINRCTNNLEAGPAQNAPYPEPSELISASDLQTVLQKQASSRQVRSEPTQQAHPSILERVRGWIGLSAQVNPANGRGLLERIAQTGLPLRNELIEGLDALHQNLQKMPCSDEQLRRAQGGAVLLDQLREIGDLLRSAHSLNRAGHGQEAGFEANLLRKLDDDIALTERAITHVIALKDESVKQMPERKSWQDWVIKH
jgi:hypothetical protein